MESRVDRLRKKMAEKGLPALFLFGQETLTTGQENLRYVSGFTGSTGLGLVTPEVALFFADPRYHLQAAQECREFEVVPCPSRLFDCAMDRLREIGLKTLGLEKACLTLANYLDLQEKLPGVTFEPIDALINEMRLVKEPGEVEAIRAACGIVDRAFEHILTVLKEGISERELGIELDYHMRQIGADKPGFDSIVAFGPHSAHPHARPTDRKLERGQFVKLDFGAFLNSYNSDITRTVVFGPATDRHREIYDVVFEAQQRALDTLKPGLKGQEVDAAARDLITERGYGDNFGHGLGHGLGREVHDGGALNATSELIIEPGQVWTLEPGVYIEGFGGVRIEDDAVVTESGCDVLTTATKRFTVID